MCTPSVDARCLEEVLEPAAGARACLVDRAQRWLVRRDDDVLALRAVENDRRPGAQAPPLDQLVGDVVADRHDGAGALREQPLENAPRTAR